MWDKKQDKKKLKCQLSRQLEPLVSASGWSLLPPAGSPSQKQLNTFIHKEACGLYAFPYFQTEHDKHNQTLYCSRSLES